MAGDAEKGYVDQGSSFGETLEGAEENLKPVLKSLKTAYDAYVDAGETVTKPVEKAFTTAAIAIKDAGLSLKGGLQERIFDPDFWLEKGKYENSGDWLDEVNASIGRFFTSASKGLLDHFVATPAKGLAKIARSVVTGENELFSFKEKTPSLDLRKAPGRVEHQKKLLETIAKYLPRNREEAKALLAEANAPRQGGERLNWNQYRYDYPVADPDSSDAKNMVLDWVQSLGPNELETFTNKETYDEFQRWVNSAPSEGATINDQMVWMSGLEFGGERAAAKRLVNSLATDDPEVFEGPQRTRFENVLKGDFTPTGLVDRRRGTGEVVNPADSTSQPTPATSTEPQISVSENVTGSVDDQYLEFQERTQQDNLEKVQARATSADEARRQRDPGYRADPNYAGELPFGTRIEPEADLSGTPSGGGGGNQTPAGSDLSDAAVEYIRENFGSVEFFRTKRQDEMRIDTNGDGEKDMNIIDYIESTGEQNPDVIWALFQRTDWFAQNGPTARQFQMNWDKAGGAIDWTPNYDLTTGSWLNTTPDMLEMLEDTYDSLTLEANRLGINTDKVATKNALMAMSYIAKQLNMTDYEIKNEFITGFNGSFNVQNVQSSGTFANIKQQLRQNAATYMIKLDDTALPDYANKIHLGKSTYEGITAGHAQAVMDTEPALKSLVEQGYTPSAYFSTYSNAASQLLGRNVDFLGVDNKMFRHITDSMQTNDGLNRPMTRGEFERYVRSTPEWDYSDNARDEAYSTVDTLLNSFGVRV